MLNANKQGGADHVTSHVNGGGQGWVAWQDNGSVFAQCSLVLRVKHGKR